MIRHPHGEQERPTQRQWYSTSTPVGDRRSFVQSVAFERFLDDVDVLLCYETPFDWRAVHRCRERGIPAVLIPMYEWYPERVPPGSAFDAMIFPSLLDEDYFRADYPTCPTIPVPADPTFPWRERTRARRFLHNAGNIGSRNHKGTLELLRAVPLTTTPFQLTVRCQDAAGLRRLIAEVPEVERDSRVQFQFGPVPREKLFEDHDVYVAPEKYNGLSLPLQEAFQSGMLVLTTDRYPVNTWLPRSALIPRSDARQVRVAPGHLVIEESVVDPAAVASAIDYWYDKDVTGMSRLGRDWAKAHSWDALRPRYRKFLEDIAR